MFTKTILKNGLKLIISPLHETNAVTVLVLVKVGSRYEAQKINGVSHFIEHMMFKGTKKRPNTLAISKELDAVGAEYNAFTAKDHTGYYIKTAGDHLELALDMLSDMLFNSKFEPAEMEREKKVIIEEINMYEDNPLMYIESLFEESMYWGNSLGWQISGTRESMTKMERGDFLNYQQEFYQPFNMLISIAGKLSKDVSGLVEKYFSPFNKLRAGGKSKKAEMGQYQTSRIGYNKPRVKLQFKETEQVQLALGFPAVGFLDPRKYAADLLAIILGGNMSSRLFISVREKRGLAYFIRASLNHYRDVGNLLIHAGLDKSRLPEALKVILLELNKVKKQGVTSVELKRAKEFIKGHLTLELEDSASLASWWAQQEVLIGKILTPEEKLKKIFSVTQADVKKAAFDIISESRLNMALIGPFKEEGPFLKLLRM